MSNGFIHSVKVPRLYKTVATIVRIVREDGGSLKTLIYEKKHPNVAGIYALCVHTLQRGVQLDHLIRKTQILINEPRLDAWLARVLITELLWGKKCLNSDCKPVQTILSYESQLREELKNIGNLEIPELCNKIARKPRYVRINTVRLSVKDGITNFQDEGWLLLPKCSSYASHLDTLRNLSDPYFIQDFHIPELLIFPPDTSFYKHPAYLKGEIVLQDKASCLPAYLLNPEPGTVVLDLCAAPGMKTTHLAAIMKNEGKIYAVELDQRRYVTLCEQIELTDSICVTPLKNDALNVGTSQCPDVEYILIDPSCSGSGMIDRQTLDGESDKSEPERLKSLQSFQVLLLRHALSSFPMAKRITYSTCSIKPEENEQVIDQVLSSTGNSYRLVPAQSVMGDNWINYSSKEYNCSDKCLYAKPEVDLCNGFFVAILERNFSVPLPEYKRKVNRIADENQTQAQKSPLLEEAKPQRNRKKRGKKKRKTDEVFGSLALAGEETDNIQVSSLTMANELDESVAQVTDDEPPKKKKKKKEKSKCKGEEREANQSDVEKRTKSKKTKSKCKKEEGIGEEGVVQNEDKEAVEINQNDAEKGKKKKKRKKKIDGTE